MASPCGSPAPSTCAASSMWTKVCGRGYQSIAAEVILDSPAPELELLRLKEIVDRHCLVPDILRSPTPVHLSLKREALSVAAE